MSLDLLTRALTKSSTRQRVNLSQHATDIVLNVINALENHGEVLRSELAMPAPRPYTNPRTGRPYRYKRTGQLGLHWHVDPIQDFAANGSLECFVTNDVVDRQGEEYAPKVQDATRQRPDEHKITWANHTIQAVQRRNAPKLNGAVHTAIQKGQKGERTS